MVSPDAYLPWKPLERSIMWYRKLWQHAVKLSGKAGRKPDKSSLISRGQKLNFAAFDLKAHHSQPDLYSKSDRRADLICIRRLVNRCARSESHFGFLRQC